MKSEPSTYSIDDLQRDKKTFWHGVRNYQARNFMRDKMKVKDLVLFYHSNSNPSGIAGVARVIKQGYPDLTALDPKSEYYDPKATKENPIWFMVNIEFLEKFPHLITLHDLKKNKSLNGMMLTRPGSRLSVQPVEQKHFEIVQSLGKVLKTESFA
jgi:predicted RNA-binding protein with PUA-like domain